MLTEHDASVWDSVAQLVLAVGLVAVAFLAVMAVYLLVEWVAERVLRRLV